MPKNILVRGVNWLGDAVMTTPALQRLREAAPEARITLLTHEKLADLWSGYPHVDQVLTFRAGESAFSVARRLNADLALILPNSPRSALECFLARVPRRVGFARGGRSILLTDPVPMRQETVHLRKRSAAEIRRLADSGKPRTQFAATGHQIHDYLHLLRAMGFSAEPTPPKLYTDDAELRRKHLDDKLWFGLNPGAEYGPAKRWPAELYVQAAREIQRLTGCAWVVFGGVRDKPLTQPIASALGALDLTGRTTLRELAACFRGCKVLLTNDTGPMHLAAAVGTPVVVPFGSTSPELTGPQTGMVLTGNAGCAPCFRRECPIDFRCMRSITVEQVIQATLQVFAAAGAGGHCSR